MAELVDALVSGTSDRKVVEVQVLFRAPTLFSMVTHMGKTRVEAFSDGVIAILITIMVLELKVPHDTTISGLLALAPVFFSYVLSFIYLGIYWNNHHHMLHLCHQVTGKIMWANLHLLFWLSLIPFATGWVGENHFAQLPVAVYGLVLFMSAISYWILQMAIISSQGEQSTLRKAVGKDIKGKLSPALYLLAIGSAFLNEWFALSILVLVALMWLIPDKRIESKI